MVVVCAGEFVKEVCQSIVFYLYLDNDEELPNEDGDLYCGTISGGASHCICSRSFLKNESVRSSRVRGGGPK
jgi:hypothetical protein